MQNSRTFTITGFAVLFTFLLVGVSCRSTTIPSEPKVLELEGDLRVHDPVIIFEKDTFYVFSTGGSREESYPFAARRTCTTGLNAGMYLTRSLNGSLKKPRGPGVHGLLTSPITTANSISTIPFPLSAAGIPLLGLSPTRHSIRTVRIISGSTRVS